MTVRNTTTSELKEGKLVKKKAVKGTETYTMSIMKGTFPDFFRFITFMTRLMFEDTGVSASSHSSPAALTLCICFLNASSLTLLLLAIANTTIVSGTPETLN